MSEQPQHNGAHVLDLIESYQSRFLHLPSRHALTVVTLWPGVSHLQECFDTSPRLVFASPQPASGKSRALGMQSLFARNAKLQALTSPAYIYRTKSDQPDTTLLLDEFDMIYGAAGRTPGSETTTGILNSGFNKDVTVGRMDKVQGGGFRAVEFTPFGPVAMAGLHKYRLPAALRSRSIIIDMAPPRPGERPQPWRARDYGAEAADLYDLLVEWADTVRPQVTDARPVLPPGIVDRKADVWEPLIAVADAAGGKWPTAARGAAVWFTEQPTSLGVQLLADVRQVFEDRPGVTALWTTELIAALRTLPETAWDDGAGGHELSPRRLAQLLTDYQVRSRDIRQGDRVLKGYHRAAFNDAWARYLPEQVQEPAPTDPTPGERRARRRGRGRRSGHNTNSPEEAA